MALFCTDIVVAPTMKANVTPLTLLAILLLSAASHTEASLNGNRQRSLIYFNVLQSQHYCLCQQSAIKVH